MTAPRPLGLDSLAKTQSRIIKVAVALWAVGVAISLAVTGLVIWALVLLIQHLS